MTRRATVTDPQRARAARAGRGKVRPRRRAVSRRRIRVGRGGREMDGKSIMGLLLLAAAQRQRNHDFRRRPDEDEAIAALVRAGRARVRRGAMRLNGLGVSPGIGVGQGAGGDARRPATCASAFPQRRVGRELERLDAGAAAVARAARSTSRARIAAAAGAEHAYLFDAQLLMLDDPMLIERAATIIRDRAAERGVGARSARSTRSRRCSIEATIRYLRERKGDVADVVGRLCMNLRAGGRSGRPVRGHRGPAGARRRRAHARR